MNSPSRAQLQTMLDLQDSMNCKVHPNWRQQGYEWYRAIWIECAELMDHIGYKWWKKQDTDWPQVQLEVIDIWHFGMSDQLARVAQPQRLASEILSAIENHQAAALSVHEATEALAQSSLANKAFAVGDFINLMIAAKIDFDTLYVSYVGKNVLNFFRQDNGYKDGSYQKQWAGREDNEHLSEIVARLDSGHSEFGEQIYQALSERYQQCLETA